MTEPLLVRELEPQERPAFETTKTGDLLPDGSVLLRTTDMERMGLRGLRTWLFDQAFRNRLVIALISDAGLPWRRLPDIEDGIEFESAVTRMQTP